jgi:hypothetical protein
MEKRHSQRKPISLSVSVSRNQNSLDTASGSAHLLNLSNSGAMIQLGNALFADEICSISLAEAIGQSDPIDGRVIWIEPLPDKSYQAGLAFRNLTPDQEYLLEMQLVHGGK